MISSIPSKSWIGPILACVCLMAWPQTLAGQGERGFVQTGPLTLEKMRVEKRLALVIGNGKYASAPLANPTHDAKAMAKALEGLGFEVTLLTDADQREMKRAINAFGEALVGGGGVGLFYFAGHGIQVNGQNYLLPVGARIDGEADVDIEAVRVEAVLAKMENARNRLNLVILDACRNNPFPGASRDGSRGLAVDRAATGTLVAYATAPGSVAADGKGKNGTYTAALLRHIGTEGLPVETMFKAVREDVLEETGRRQTPWENSSIVGDFYFRVPSNSGKVAPAPRETEACPEGTEARKDGVCVPKVVIDCPHGTTFESGRGCVAVMAKAPAIAKAAVEDRPTRPSDQTPAVASAPRGMVEIPAGRFTMGSPSSEEGRSNDEVPHEVTISRSFWLHTTEVTQGQWRAVMGNNPSSFSSCGDACPVENVSWWEAVAYANALSKKEGLRECYVLRGCDGKAPGEGMACQSADFAGLSCEGYRLPTEAEWEYAARAGTKGARHGSLDSIAWHGGNSGSKTHAAGGRQANAWGLHDMLGNVWEWTTDGYEAYPGGSQRDPLVKAGSGRVYRGGSWCRNPRYVRAADRDGYDPGYRYGVLGFRLARSSS